MTKISFLTPKFKIVLILLILTTGGFTGFSQSDTLHLYYKGLLTQTPDSNEAKIAAWAKSLNGRHVDIQVLAYYERSEFKKYSQERSDGLYNIINRKARELITIKFIGPKKGEKSQRSTVDIVYVTSGSSPAVVKEKEKEPVVNKANNPTPAPKDKEKKVAATEKPDSPARTKEKEPEKTEYDPNVLYDTSYVNGQMIVKKRAPKKKEKEKVVKAIELDPNYRYDTTFINGEMKITKKKVKK